VVEELVADPAIMQSEMQMRILLEEMGAYYDLAIRDSPPGPTALCWPESRSSLL
jgi:hypothetical protein